MDQTFFTVSPLFPLYFYDSASGGNLETNATVRDIDTSIKQILSHKRME